MQRNSSSESLLSIINSTCLFEIFKQIKIRCESQQHVSNENPVDQQQLIPNDNDEEIAIIENDSREIPNDDENNEVLVINNIGNIVIYLDLIRFVKSCQWTIEQFYFWDEELSYQLGIDQFYLNTLHLSIDFDNIYDGIKGLPKKDQDTYLKFFEGNIRDFTTLETVDLTYKCETYYEKHLEVFAMIMNALQSKCLSEFTIDVKGYTLENVPCCCGLIGLFLNVRTNAEELVKWCKSNPNLRKLSLLNNEIYGRLSDITLDENSLKNLKELEFLMKADVNAAEYAPLAKLPSLQTLTIYGQHEIGSLESLFYGLADNNPHRFLSTLRLVDAAMNDEETSAISQIKYLKNLSSGFIKAQSIGHLSQLSELEELEIFSKHKLSKMLPEISKILKATKKSYLSIEFPNFSVSYTKFNDELRWMTLIEETETDIEESQKTERVSEEIETDSERNEVSGYANFWEILELRELFLTFGSCNNNATKSKSVFQNMIMGLAKAKNTLQYLSIFHEDNDCELSRINTNMALKIAAIKTLKSIDWNFNDLSNIYILGQLPQLEKLSIGDRTANEQDAPEDLKKLFRVLASNPFQTFQSLEITGLSIDLPLAKEIVQIKSLKRLKCSFSDDECIKCLDRLTKLEDIQVYSEHDFNNVSDAILSIGSTGITNLRISEISISRFINEKNVRLYLARITERDEFMTQIKYAKYAELGTLENCHSFAITGQCKAGSLHLLIQTLATNQNNNLKVLDIKNYEVNFEESLLISQIETLEKLVCIFSDPRSFEVTYPKTYFKQIEFNGTGFPNQIFGFFNNSNGKVTIRNDNLEISYYKSQRKLILENVSTEIFSTNDCLGNLDDLQTLYIIYDYLMIIDCNYNHKRNSFTKLFGKLASKPRLKELIIEERYIEYKINMNSLDLFELLEIAQLTSLRKLKCGFSDSENIQNFEQLKELQDLTITTHQRGTLHILFQGLSSPLQFLTIEKEITFDELKTICQIKSLRRLECSFSDTENDDALPTLPHLKELCIKSHRKSTLFDKLRLFKNSVLQNIIILGDPLDAQDVDALAQCKTLKTVHISLSQLENTNRLLPLKELEELQIEENLCDILNLSLMNNLLNIEKNFRSLRKLVIRDHDINNKEITKILQLPALKSLNCFIYIDGAANLEGLEKLEELIIEPKRDSLNMLLQTLIEKSSSAIKSLVINQKVVDMEEIVLISQITSLTSLELEDHDDKSLYNLKDLINLEALKIMAKVELQNIWDSLLTIARDCSKLELMQLRGAKKTELDVLAKALKSVRDPILQKPLKLIWKHIDWQNRIDQEIVICDDTIEFNI